MVSARVALALRFKWDLNDEKNPLGKKRRRILWNRRIFQMKDMTKYRDLE